MTILFKELAGSPVETFDAEGMTAQRRLLCAYEDRHAVVATLLGDGYGFGGRAESGYPGCPGVVAVRARIEPFDGRPDDQGAFSDLAADLNSYSGQFVEVVVDYELLDGSGSRSDLPAPEAGTLVTYRMTYGGEYLKLPGHALQWQAGTSIPVPPDAVPTLRLPIAEHHVTWHRVVNPPWAAIRACLGAINNAPFLGAAAETMLCDGAKADRQFAGFDGLHAPQSAWRITYLFREKAIKLVQGDEATTYGWNHAHCDVLPQSRWDRLLDEHGNTLYRAEDFTSLFRFA